jgi:hypothetical protein
MDLLEKTIQLMEPSRKRAFRQSLMMSAHERKDVDLFDLICSTKSLSIRGKAHKKLKQPNANAYHSLRKRLFKKLIKFLSLHHPPGEDRDEAVVEMYQGMAQFAIERKDNSLAAKYYTLALRIAQKSKLVFALDQLYRELIEHAEILDMDITALFNAWQENTRERLFREKLLMSRTIVLSRLIDAKKHGNILDFDDVVKSVFKEVHLDKAVMIDAYYQFELVSLIRSVAASSRAYLRFEKFALEVYERLRLIGNLEDQSPGYRAGWYYIIAHAQYRNRKFSSADGWLEKLASTFKESKSSTKAVYGVRYMLLRSAVLSYTGRNTEAIDWVKKSLADKTLLISPKEMTIMQLNLAVWHFQSKNYKKANQTILKMQHSDGWIEKHLGKEWLFKKNLIELIIQVEMGNDEITLSRIKTIEKRFAPLLHHEFYQRAGIFMGLIRYILLNPEKTRTNQFAARVEAAQLGWPEEEEDLQAMTFFCWLKARMTGRDYYELVLETLQSR